MNVIKVIVTIAVSLVVLSIIPKIIIHDSIALTAEEIKCAKLEASHLFENPIEGVVIQKIAVERKEKGVSYVSAYTLGGLKYATAEVVCNDRAHVTWRRWFSE